MPADLSMLVPTIRTQHWRRLYDSMVKSMGSRTFELVLVGPKKGDALDDETNVVFIEDWGSPCRCTQKAILSATGKYISWTSDDAVYRPGALETAIIEREALGRKDVVGTRYTEGPNFTGTEMPPEWFFARHHDDLRIDGVLPHWRINLSPIMDREYFIEIGGLDCQYEHINMSVHDLLFRMQNDGGIVQQSSIIVMDLDHLSGRDGDHGPLYDCHVENDAPKFKIQYAQYNPDRLKIPYDNWKDSPEKWARRFG